MYCIRTLDGESLQEQFFPPFRKINFGDDSAVMTVSSLLPYAWNSIPTDNSTIANFMRDTSYLSDAEREALPSNPDLTIHTKWRDDVYRHWNHVYYDVMNFLQEAAPGVGHLHPPSHDVLPVPYQTQTKKWDTSVLLIPTYLVPGVKVRLDTTGPDQKTLGVFDGMNTTEIFWLMKGTEVTTIIEGQEKEGLAAVLAVGVLCDCGEE
ncbi:hypothetical protein C8J56DRAFT_892507 [Mycena floridula]|nr:hypothetical protein C8J56DRAFT_892507 [Mycena floridula]